ncbi:acyl-CoA dehydrogenase [Serendipita vermifera]|nr:acyl-CoA dehydrogenase [Serendipita vermifera]
MTSLKNNPFAEPAWQTLKSPYYNESHRELQKEARKFFEEEIFPYAEAWEEAGETPVEVLHKLAAKGWILPFVKPEYRPKGLGGNPEWDIFHAMILQEEAHRCPHVGVIWGLTSGIGIGLSPVMHFGSEAQKRRYVPPGYEAKERWCLGITEPEAGSDVAGIRTTATLTQDKKHYIVSGVKKWITGGLWADYITAAVRTGPLSAGAAGISFLIIPLNSPGVKRRRIRVSGLHASGSTFFEFNDVKVPVENLLGREGDGFHMVMANFNPERFNLAIMCVRMARTCVEEAWKHALTRKTFGKTLMSHQVIRAKFASMVRAVESCHAWLEELAWHIKVTPNAFEKPEVGARIALVKVQAARVLELCVREAQQVFGGLGATKDGKGRVVEQISRDVRIFVVGGGSEEILDDLSIRSTVLSATRKGKL